MAARVLMPADRVSAELLRSARTAEKQRLTRDIDRDHAFRPVSARVRRDPANLINADSPSRTRAPTRYAQLNSALVWRVVKAFTSDWAGESDGVCGRGIGFAGG